MGRAHSAETIEKIRTTKAATKERRSAMDLKVFDLKIIDNKLSQTQRLALRLVFLQYKWCRNYLLSEGKFEDKLIRDHDGYIPVRVPGRDEPEMRPINFMGAHIKQDVASELRQNTQSLTALKRNGHKVGALKFVTEVKTIGLKNHGDTYSFRRNRAGEVVRVQIQKLPGTFRLRGGDQLSVEGIEFANAKLTRRADGYHLLVTAYVPLTERPAPSAEVGIDFGVKTAYTLSDGTEFNPRFEEPETLKRLQRKLERQIKGSNGWEKTRARLNREYGRLSNRKDNWANQFVHRVASGNHVYFQDEKISTWKRKNSEARGGRAVQHGTMGRVKERLRRSEHSTMLPSCVATTAWCPRCGSKTSHQLSQRIYTCRTCGHRAPRDLHASENMVVLGKKLVKIITSGTEGGAGGETVRLSGAQKQLLYAVEGEREQVSVKPEAATSSVSP